MLQRKVGDKIEFSKLPDLQEKLLVNVIDLYKEDNFENLFRKLYTDEEEIKKKANSMYQYYSPEKEKHYKEPYKGLYNFVGGKVEDGETNIE